MSRNKNDKKKLSIPDNLDNETKALYTEMMESIRESSKRARGAILNERGQLLWEEPLDEYEKRMIELKGSTGSCIPNAKVIVDGLPLPKGRSECIKGFIVKERKPSPPPPPPMRKYKTRGFLGIDILVNQDEIDAHRATMDKWREGNLK